MTIADYGPLSATELCQVIDVPLLTLYPHLNALETAGVLESDRDTVRIAVNGATPRQ
jgi:DNA-binding transcriptional ArsR family regulator